MTKKSQLRVERDLRKKLKKGVLDNKTKEYIATKKVEKLLVTSEVNTGIYTYFFSKLTYFFKAILRIPN